MRIEWTKLKNLPVETKSGQTLGHVKDFILETDGQNILQYEVGGLFGKRYLVSREQVLNIDEKKIVVEDGVKKIEFEIKNKVESGAGMESFGSTQGKPVVMREETGN